MSTIKINSMIKTIEIVKCDSGFMLDLYDYQGSLVSRMAISTLGYAGYAGTAGSLLEAIQVALTPKITTPAGE